MIGHYNLRQRKTVDPIPSTSINLKTLNNFFSFCGRLAYSALFLEKISVVEFKRTKSFTDSIYLSLCMLLFTP